MALKRSGVEKAWRNLKHQWRRRNGWRLSKKRGENSAKAASAAQIEMASPRKLGGLIG